MVLFDIQSIYKINLIASWTSWCKGCLLYIGNISKTDSAKFNKFRCLRASSITYNIAKVLYCSGNINIVSYREKFKGANLPRGSPPLPNPSCCYIAGLLLPAGAASAGRIR